MSKGCAIPDTKACNNKVNKELTQGFKNIDWWNKIKIWEIDHVLQLGYHKGGIEDTCEMEGLFNKNEWTINCPHKLDS